MTRLGAIDHSRLEELLDVVGGDEESVMELIAEFFDDAPRQIAAMKAALVVESADAFRCAAHSLKSNSATFWRDALGADVPGSGRDGQGR